MYFSFRNTIHAIASKSLEWDSSNFSCTLLLRRLTVVLFALRGPNNVLYWTMTILCYKENALQC